MLKKFASVVLVAALVCTFSATHAFAGAPSKVDAKTGETSVRSNSAPEAPRVAGEKLKTQILKLVTDAKVEGTGVTLPRPQVQSPHGNSLSGGAKIAIGVGIGIAVVVLILVSQRCNNEPGSC